MRRQIEKACREGRLVRIVRRKRWDRLDGVVVGVGETWLLMATEVDAGYYNHSFVRCADVRAVDALPGAGFVERALASEACWPMPMLALVDLSSTVGVLASAAGTEPLVAIHDERAHADECLIGVPHDFRRRKFRLRTVDIVAAWEPDDTVLRYDDVTRVDVGGQYERRLARIAGAAPAATRTHGGIVGTDH